MDYKDVFKVLARVSKKPVLLVDLEAKVLEHNEIFSNISHNVCETINNESFLKLDAAISFKKYLKTASKSLNLINSGASINGKQYILECARFMPEGGAGVLLLLYINERTSVKEKFQELNDIYNFSYDVAKNKSLEKKLINQAKEIERSEKEISKLFKVDDVTKLATRDYFLELLKESIQVANLLKNKLAIIYCDIDNFKKVNERYGRCFGDKLLKTIADKIKLAVPQNTIISRFNADQFAIMLKGNKHVSKFETYLQKLEKIFSNKIIVEGIELYNTASFGIVFYPEEGNTAETLITNLELTKDKAKAMMGTSRCYFSKEIKENYSRFNKIEIGLRKAIENNELFLVYQPQYCLKEKRFSGIEVLCRWNDEHLGTVSPAEFILVAEESILIKDLTVYVFKLALSKFKGLLERNPILKDIELSLNVSTVYLNDKTAFNELMDLANSSGVDSKNICFEITETALMENTKVAVDLLNKSKRVGYSHAIDDFGVGQSSLSYLRSLPVNQVKIDGSFIRNIDKNKGDLTIVKAIINLVSTLGFKTVAECVETKEQLELLKEIECDSIQGYYTGRPVLMSELEKIIVNKFEY
ncbi:EAL domain-containing protein [Francisella sp. Scap27]|uniref:putative bifunctional diguanylate cyclase/phosphodiesterase n=1 Tax=Francisella sp. Scap27 TaxID=2589986 RepID=UPI0015BD477E|nr:GGDEF domain-containing phosphodiesterase [Francisella sp. Scap27]QLE78304.1 EAL domain-containing protein [Francisella sp. Scap27]